MRGETRLRQFVRRPVMVEFRVLEAGGLQSGELLFDSLDLSVGGAFLRSDLLLNEGQILEVTFSLPAGKAVIRCRARVVWVARQPEVKREAGMGLQFVDLDPGAQAAIAQFVQSVR